MKSLRPLSAGLLLACAGMAQAAESVVPVTDRAEMFSGLWGWMRALCFWLLDLLQWLAAFTHSWGIAIILVAVLVRLFTYPFARRALAEQKRFNEAQQKLEPTLREIKQQYKGGEQSERVIALYDEHGVSPMAGVKPLLIVLLQLPVFIALFQILRQTPDLHGARFLWIPDLSQPDRLFGLGVTLPWFGDAFNLLPFLLTATILLSAFSVPGESQQDTGRRKRLLITGAMAAVFFVVFYSFPAGLVLYWISANLLHVAQQRLAARRPPAAADASR
jgi:YidC/Oxa1 family membrane protein insertase